MNLENRIERFISSHHMVDPGDRVLVSVSGGPDSVALLSLLHVLRAKWSLTLSVVHFDHGMRGRESDGDESFVTNLCQNLRIPCRVKKLSMPNIDGRAQRPSIQEYARNARYQELGCLATELEVQKVAVGHTADDQVETLIMWMVRGAGTKGLCGIPPVRTPNIIRPLLGTTRSELLAYLNRQKLEYRIDSSNEKMIYLRNRIRQEVMPVLRKYNPKVSMAVARQVDIVREEDLYLDQLAREALAQLLVSTAEDNLKLHRTRFMELSMAIRRRVLRIVLQEISGVATMPSFDAVEIALKHIDLGQSGLRVTVHGVSIIREYEQIHVCRPQVSTIASQVVQPLMVSSEVVWPLTGQTINVSAGECLVPEVFPEANAFQVRFDADACSLSFVLRNWMAGDHFAPLGMGGKKKKLQDFFSDIKLERSKRHTVPLLVAPEGIVWVGGYRLDHRFRVTDSTKHVLVANLSEVSKSL